MIKWNFKERWEMKGPQGRNRGRVAAFASGLFRRISGLLAGELGRGFKPHRVVDRFSRGVVILCG